MSFLAVSCISSKTPQERTKTAKTNSSLVDRNTDIHPGSCNCANPKKVCTKSVIESTRGDLTARRLDAGKDLDAWNLAALSLYQQPQSLKDHLVEHLKLVSVNFASVQGK